MTAAQWITVYCAEPSHAERRWDVMRFSLTDGGQWIASNLRFKSTQRVLDGEVKTMMWLEDDRRYRALTEDMPPSGTRTRTRPRLKCDLCGLEFVRHDTKVLYGVLDKLADAGQPEISLRALINLAANISRSTRR
jgi:hypothetical protein